MAIETNRRTSKKTHSSASVCLRQVVWSKGIMNDYDRQENFERKKKRYKGYKKGFERRYKKRAVEEK